jgi:cation:H+ antiporter
LELEPVALIKLFGGLTYLLIAGDVLVRGALALARKARIPPMVVGLTVVAFGTSAPELFVGVSAALKGLPGISVGNVIGSNIANVLLVLGLPALIHAMECSQPSARRDGAVMLGASVFAAALCTMGALSNTQGTLLLIGLGLYLWLAMRSGQLEADELESEVSRVLGLPSQSRTIALFVVVGLLCLQLGARLTVDGVVAIAERAGIPETVVALTAVAVGTSLPELATTLIAAFQRQSDVALGNVLGSNVFNLLAILGLTIFAAPEPVVVPEEILHFDVPVMLGAGLVLTLFTWTGRSIGRRSGVVLLGAYVAYVALLLERHLGA